MAIGVGLALEGLVTAGALIATMLLTWRVTGPAQAFFLGLPRLLSLRAALARLDTAFDLPVVSLPNIAKDAFPKDAPVVEFQSAFYRHSPDADPAIAGISFRVEPGTITVVTGPNGAGKTTLLKLVGGMLQTQSGRVLVNGRDLRQYDPDTTRLATLYWPSSSQFMLWKEDGLPIPAPDAGRRPRLGPRRMSPAALEPITASIVAEQTIDELDGRHGLCLLDDPLGCADDDFRAGVLSSLEALRGRATVFFTTHDISLVPHADNALILDRGALFPLGPCRHSRVPSR